MKHFFALLFISIFLLSSNSCTTDDLEKKTIATIEKNPSAKVETKLYFNALKYNKEDEYLKARNILTGLESTGNTFITEQAQLTLMQLATENEDWDYFTNLITVPRSTKEKFNVAYGLLQQDKEQLNDEESDYITSVVYDLPTSSYHVKLAEMLNSYDIASDLSWQTKSYAQGKEDIYRQRSTSAKKNIGNSDTSKLLKKHPQIMDDLRRAYTGSGEELSWAKSFIKISKQKSSNEDFRYTAIFTSARLAQSAGDKTLARRYYEDARKAAKSPTQQDRALWYQMNLNQGDVETFFDAAAPLAKHMNSPRYFDDLYEKYVAKTIQDREWLPLQNFYVKAEDYLSNEMKSQIAWTLWVLSQYDYIDDTGHHQDWLETAYESDPGSYWSFLSAYVLNRSPVESWISSRDANEDVPLTDESVKVFLEGYIKHGFLLEGAEWILDYPGYIALPELSNYSQKLQDAELNLQSIQIAGRGVYQTQDHLSKKDLELLYPNRYSSLIKRYSKEYDFNPTLIFALIRTESAFVPDIESHAGALGLMQLMPATAREQARKLGRKSIDLTNPKDNIEIASNYIHWLYDRERVSNDAQMLIAYNGGIGNLSKWQRSFGDIEDFLFTEALPYYETRNYVRKIITRSMIYYELYFNGDYRERIENFYPQMHSLLENNRIALLDVKD